MSYYKKVKRKVRYDRIASAFIILIVIIFFTINIIKSVQNINPINDKLYSMNDSSYEVIETTTNITSKYDKLIIPYNNVKKGSLILVNLNNMTTFSEDANSIVSIYYNKSDSYVARDLIISMNISAIKALNSMMNDYNQMYDASKFIITHAYRTKEEQDSVYNNYIQTTDDIYKTAIFPGGFSDYNTGFGFDLGYIYTEWSEPYSPNGDNAWIAENANRYGFILRYPENKNSLTGHKDETYHYRYVGLPHSAFMNANNMCLEEYVSLISSYTLESPLNISAYGTHYEIYFVMANPNENTDVYVPKNSSYTISGNNINGFVITIEK